MKKAVLFKSESEEYREAFREARLEAVFVEPLSVSGVGGAALAERLLRPHYAGLVLSSARAVDAAAACWDPARFVLWSSKRVYAVGEATARRAAAALGLEARGAGAGDARALAELIARENPPRAEFLFPCGALRSEALPAVLAAADIAVDSLAVYETKEHPALRDALLRLAAPPAPSCLVFFSPSGCEYVHRQLQTFINNLSQLPRFAIGNSTAHKIENLGLEIAGVAAKPRPDCLVEAVQKYFESVQGGS